MDTLGKALKEHTPLKQFEDAARAKPETAGLGIKNLIHPVII
jgi:hypothetical protein